MPYQLTHRNWRHFNNALNDDATSIGAEGAAYAGTGGRRGNINGESSDPSLLKNEDPRGRADVSPLL